MKQSIKVHGASNTPSTRVFSSNKERQGIVTPGAIYVLSQVLPTELKNSDVPELNASKIGMVKSLNLGTVKRRVSGLQTGNPFPLEICLHIPCKDPGVMERYWHQVFDDKRLSGEWFLITQEDRNGMYEVTKHYFETGEFIGEKKILDEIILRQSTVKTVSSDGIVSTKSKRAATRLYLKEILDRHRTKLQRSGRFERSELTNEEFKTVYKALGKHPGADRKIGVGVASIFVQRTQYKVHGSFSYCFHVKRVDGSEEDFSYQVCFGRIKLRHNSRHYTWEVK